MQNKDIMIEEGWYVSDVSTSEEADEAFAALNIIVANIQQHIDLELDKPRYQQDRKWLAKANAALRYKKTALQLVQSKRALLAAAERQARQETYDRKLLNHIKATVGHDQFVAWVREAEAVV